jgi:AAA family ATP:ADP antiporter
MTYLIERLLRLQPGDIKRGALLFGYLFFVITSYVVGKAVRNSLFLEKFQALKLPYADIASAVLVGIVVAGYVMIGRRTTLRNLLIGSLAVYAASCVVFWWLAHFFQFEWLYPAIYIWVSVFGVLAPAQVWTLSNYVLTAREAKRVFALVGGGAIAGWIFGGFLTAAGAKLVGTESLLLAMAVLLAMCIVFVVYIWRQGQANIGAQEAEKGGHEEVPQNFLESMRTIRASTYLQAIAAVICLSSFVTTIAGWQFRAFVQEFILGKTQRTVFFGNFDFICGIICLLTQLLITSRLLRRFGIGPALFTVPMALLFGSVGVLVWGTLIAAVLLKGSDQVLRYSIDKSSVELLYLPVPPAVKLQAKSFIDTVIWRLGDGLAGVAMAVVADHLRWSASRVSWLNIVFILGWLGAAFVARRNYVETLRHSIHQHRLDAERASAPVLDRSATNLLADRLQAADPQEILYALGLFEVERRQAAHPAVRGLLNHPSQEVRQKAISILNVAVDTSVTPAIERLLADPQLEVRTEALLFLARHAHIDPLERLELLGDFADFSIRAAMVAYLAHPGPAQNVPAAGLLLAKMANEEGTEGKRVRLEAARLIGLLPDWFSEQHRLLLEDPDPEVACEAIRAVGRLRNRRFVLTLLDRLAEPALAPDVVDALAQFGDGIVGTLRDHLNDPKVPIETRREIPAILARFGTSEAARVLTESLLEGDTQLRFRIISALNKIYQSHPEIERDTQMIETVLAAEIMGHYRSYQILGTIGGLADDDPISRGLRESMNQEMERIFRLLGLLYPRFDLHSAYFGVQSSNPVVHDNALEFLDNVLQPQLRNVLVPLLDSSVSASDRARRADRIVGAKVASREEAVAALVMSSDPWLKSCGAYAVGTLGLRSLEPELDRCLEHPDPLLRDTAHQAKLRLAALAEPAEA